MVAENPLFRKWSLQKLRATVVNDIWPEVVFFASVAVMVTFVSIKTSHSLAVPSTLLTVLGTVLGLVISFRTSTAYERYQDGRRMWTNITSASRNLAQLFWIHVANERINSGKQVAQTNLESIIEKKTMINLVQGFSVAVKHFLRGEEGVYYEDLYPLVCILPRYASGGNHLDLLPLWQSSEDGVHEFDHDLKPEDEEELKDAIAHEKMDSSRTATASPSSWFGSKKGKPRAKSFDPEAALASVKAHRPLKPARSPPNSRFSDYLPFLIIFKWIWKKIRGRTESVLSGRTRNALGQKITPVVGESNVPLEITIYLQNYAAFLMRSSLLQPASATAVMNNINMLQDTMNHLDRIAKTPLPFAYQAHLRMSLYMYLFFLPFQIFSTFKYLTIPATACASFLLLGFLEIGQEIENPFNYDENDLDLDGFCLSIQRELQEITAHSSPDPRSFIFTHWNQPFAPADRRTALELQAGNSEYGTAASADEGLDAIKHTMLKSWKETERMTRKQKQKYQKVQA
ncbi:UPF0187-domain-containing protein [Cylindrobasidium torrendii FP15055 ss-10]|uniref:UPF0187-domain-containing protein n=1 Tax=Cylindrobasidium torrendii FP15055 ss-10 TaxID=1314674 RepID=A0A0D7B9P3_9AGAR|nr:UPF0187-domain-containing protein [Cylindrobasidium torrendii FP15055 ss-10]